MDPQALTTLPKRCDPGGFKLDVELDSGAVVPGMLDLGAEINLMPFSIFEKMELKNLKPTDLYLELADGSMIRPLGVAEDVVVIVKGIKVLVDFVILEQGKGARGDDGQLLLLGRPFMATTQTRIDVASGTLSMAGVEGSVTFSVFNDSLHASSAFGYRCLSVTIINHVDEVDLVQEIEPKLDAMEEDREDEAVIEEFLANLQEEAAIEEEFLAAIHEEKDDVEEVFFDAVQDEAEELEPVCPIVWKSPSLEVKEQKDATRGLQPTQEEHTMKSELQGRAPTSFAYGFFKSIHGWLVDLNAG